MFRYSIVLAFLLIVVSPLTSLALRPQLPVTACGQFLTGGTPGDPQIWYFTKSMFCETYTGIFLWQSFTILDCRGFTLAPTPNYNPRIRTGVSVGGPSRPHAIEIRNCNFEHWGSGQFNNNSKFTKTVNSTASGNIIGFFGNNTSDWRILNSKAENNFQAGVSIVNSIRPQFRGIANNNPNGVSFFNVREGFISGQTQWNSVGITFGSGTHHSVVYSGGPYDSLSLIGGTHDNQIRCAPFIKIIQSKDSFNNRIGCW